MDAKTSLICATNSQQRPHIAVKTGCHAPCPGHVEPGFHSNDPPGPRAPHPRAPAAQGVTRGPWRAAAPPEAAPSRCSDGAASPWRLRHALRSFRQTHCEPEPRRETSGLRTRRSRNSAAEGRSWKRGWTERETVTEEAERSVAMGEVYVNKGAGPRSA